MKKSLNKNSPENNPLERGRAHRILREFSRKLYDPPPTSEPTGEFSPPAGGKESPRILREFSRKLRETDLPPELTDEFSIPPDEKETRRILREFSGESCGLAAAFGIPHASRYVADCLILQEHRGEDSAGITSFDGENFYLLRRLGRASELFTSIPSVEELLPGSAAIGHTRYATRGAVDNAVNIQPLFFQETKFGPLAIAHNGTIKGSSELRSQLAREGVVFQTTVDSEIFGHVIAKSSKRTLREAILEMAEKIPAAYSLLILSEEKLFALRDPYGIRPLTLAKLGGGYLICSESYAIDQFPEAELMGEIEPGELLSFDFQTGRIERERYSVRREAFCIFEGIYFSDPRSRYRGRWFEDFRLELGRELYRENSQISGDVVIPVLDSGKCAAIGLSEASGIPYREYFKRIYNPPRSNRRSFTSPTDEQRLRTAYQKLHLRRELVRGKRVIVVDDSIVRATTMRIINRRLREAGVREIVTAICAPPIRDVCPFGMDFQERSQLVASNRTVEEIRQIIDSDELYYLSVEGLKRVADKYFPDGFCWGCFEGKYPT